MGALVTNNAVGTLASGINNSVLSCTLDSGQGALFPNPGAGDYFYVTLIDASNNKEIVKVTARSTNTLTIQRAQDNTSARSFQAGDRVELKPIAALHNNYAQKDSANTFVGNQTVDGDVTADGKFALNGAAATKRVVEIRSGATVRWEVGGSADAESGSDAGTDFIVNAYDDSGVLIDEMLRIARADGAAQLKAGSTVDGNLIDAFESSNVKWPFFMAAAPAGWTANNSISDHALKVVSQTSGEGGVAAGTTNFSSVFSARTIAQNNLPNATLTGTAASNGAHQHLQFVSGVGVGASGPNIGNNTFVSERNSQGSGDQDSYAMVRPESGNPDVGLGQSAGAHTHTVTTSSINGNVTQVAMDFAVKYAPCIICTKD